jgi:superfamily II DNA or RNA helicase
MSRIFDNIENDLLVALRATLQVSKRADFCVGYLNLRGWQSIDDLIQTWNPELGQQCRVLVGMQRPESADIRELYRQMPDTGEVLDQGNAVRLKHQFAAQLREQITLGIPTGKDEAGLRQFAQQLRAKQVVVKLFLPYPLHAKLYLLFRDDANNPITGFVGSSNLTLSGLTNNGELNVDVLDHLGTEKLSKWFDTRWQDRWALDVSDDLATIIETSWAREEPIPPYHIYLNMAYHLSTEARAGLSQFRLPARFEKELFEFQKSAVKIAARHLQRRGGVLIGDVVGLGKTMMATALSRMFEDDLGFETLIICPKNLEPMWEHYRREYGLRGVVMPISQVTKNLKDLRRYRLVLIDESHNLRNREGRRYKAIAEYIRQCDAKVILLSATPYNKSKTDLSAQLRLFIDEKANIGIRPEHHMREQSLSDTAFERKYQCSVNSILAIEKSDEFDDWRELIRLYMVRRTRSFIMAHYTELDEKDRPFIAANDGERRYFPVRKPLTVKFKSDESDASDCYALLYSAQVVDNIDELHVPRYGLGLYIDPLQEKTASNAEKKLIENLSRAGKRLMGFCRTNLFKRLESSGFSFLQSIERHVLRNQIYLYAIEQDLDLPIGVLDADFLDAGHDDEDPDGRSNNADDLLDGIIEPAADDVADLQGFGKAKALYAAYAREYKNNFKWIRPSLFKSTLAKHLAEDVQVLQAILQAHSPWQAAKDEKLQALKELVSQTHAKEKLLIFTQFADTARYLGRELKLMGISHLEVATGAHGDPYGLACRFSPKSNNKTVSKADEVRVMVCTDVLSEGQNLQDSHVVVNFDLPWAIIRLIQRAGRVDRIGQKAEEIYCYSFLPADGVERLIQLRARIQQRLRENAEVVGTDESFFENEDDQSGPHLPKPTSSLSASVIRDLYTEQSGVLDDTDDEVDLASYAWQIWKQAVEGNPPLAHTIETLPPVVYTAKPASTVRPDVQLALGSLSTPLGGALVYVKSPEGNDHLAWVGADGKTITESQFTILRAAECTPDTPAVPRADAHHDWVALGLRLAVSQDKAVGGGLGRPSSARRRTYETLKRYSERQMQTLFKDEELATAVDDIYQRPLLETAADLLGRLLRSGINDEELANAVKSLREENRLTYTEDTIDLREPRVVCSMGLI